MKLAFVMLAATAALAQPVHDLLLKGGHVIDPKNGINGRRDVAIAGGKIAAVAENIPASSARKVVDVSSLYVVPGLVDIHVHVFAGEGPEYTGAYSVFPDDHSFRNGVTTVVDAGSPGWRNFADFKRRTIDRSHTRVLAFLNIVGKGMGGAVEQDTTDMDPKRTAETALANKQYIVGIKTAHYAGPDWTAVDRAVEAGKIAGMPVMVDFGQFRSSGRSSSSCSSICAPATSIHTCTWARCPCSMKPAKFVLTCSRPGSGASSSTSGTARAASCSARRYPPSARASCRIPSRPTCTSGA